MKKQITRFNVAFNFNWENGVRISKIREDLATLEKLGATHIEIDSDITYDCSYITISGYVDRLETTQEAKERIAKFETIQNIIKDRELEQLKLLKDKYNL